MFVIGSRFLLSLLGTVVLPLAMAGCATFPPSNAAPLLRLSPASLGRELGVEQRLEVTAGGQTRSVDAALEIDGDSLRLAILQFGQTVARLSWDGRNLEQSLVPGWPAMVSAERVLSDLQLVWWPAAQIQAVLPVGWTVAESAQTRELRSDGRAVVTVRILGPGRIELIQPTEGYALLILSPGATPAFASP